MGPAYRYRAHVISVYDGDTVRAHVSLGFDTQAMKVQLRLIGINTPEMTGSTRAAAEAARNRLRELVLNKDVVIDTVKDRTEKYGRYLAKIYVDIGGTWLCVNDVLVSEGLAVPYAP